MPLPIHLLADSVSRRARNTSYLHANKFIGLVNTYQGDLGLNFVHIDYEQAVLAFYPHNDCMPHLHVGASKHYTTHINWYYINILPLHQYSLDL
jgi:hypothetical protein